ncbi:YidC/Oxa1 family membrane protein insertase [Romboutsia ilealis]|uniref:YidC/Oxa1 family membrane protein insertase n=1 Tax=Romboutsia ilealis TaxID=1115758 RepID=UPI0025734A06|nr:YidC/Oxa1 family membrane protein insertase [Romboutsia ilealis]
MNILSNALGHVLRIIFELVQNYGLSIILFTILVKVLLLPLTIKQTKSTKAMQDIQPKIQEIQTKYKDKPEKQQQEIMKIYTEAKINPLAGCLPLLIQMPILIALFSVLREPVTYGVFADQAQFVNAAKGFLWIKDLTTPDYILAILSGATTFLMQTLMMPKDQQQGSMKIMTYVMSAMMLFWGFSFPAGLTLYLTIGNVLAIGQHYLIMNPLRAKLAVSKEEVVDEKPRNKK